MMSYTRFALMIATSTIVMFGLMYLNTYAFEHVFYSETRAWMALLMGATMAIIMMGYMFSMYKKKVVNIAILAGSALVFVLSLWLVRSQATVDDADFMEAMIPHHSIAILTSNRAQIIDPRVRKLADEIIAAQEREIAEMRYLIADLEEGGNEPNEIFRGDQESEVMSLSDALRSVQIASLDPEPIQQAEADKVVPEGPGCVFRRTAESDPILVVRAPSEATELAQGLMKLNGELVPLEAEAGADTLASGVVMGTEGGRMAVTLAEEDAEPAVGERQEADLVFQLEQGLTVGYRGFYECEA